LSTVIIRQPTARELEWIRSQWTSDLTRAKSPSGGILIPSYAPTLESGSKTRWDDGDGYFKSPNPRVLIGQSAYRKAMCLVVPSLLSEANVLVAALASVPDESIGWIAWRDDMLLYVRVLGPARRHRVGTALFRVTGLMPDCACAWMTSDAVRWMASLQPQDEIEEAVIDG
jgi:hypothetical protein